MTSYQKPTQAPLTEQSLRDRLDYLRVQTHLKGSAQAYNPTSRVTPSARTLEAAALGIDKAVTQDMRAQGVAVRSTVADLPQPDKPIPNPGDRQGKASPNYGQKEISQTVQNWQQPDRAAKIDQAVRGPQGVAYYRRYADQQTRIEAANHPKDEKANQRAWQQNNRLVMAMAAGTVIAEASRDNVYSVGNQEGYGSDEVTGLTVAEVSRTIAPVVVAREAMEDEILAEQALAASQIKAQEQANSAYVAYELRQEARFEGLENMAMLKTGESRSILDVNADATADQVSSRMDQLVESQGKNVDELADDTLELDSDNDRTLKPSAPQS